MELLSASVTSEAFEIIIIIFHPSNGMLAL
jgi:hypothetical protein